MLKTIRNIFTLVVVSLLIPSALSAKEKSSINMSVSDLMKKYDEATAKGKDAEAVKYLYMVTEKTAGKNEPVTIRILQRYGSLLANKGQFKKAIAVLKDARKRGLVAYGAKNKKMYGLYMSLALAYKRDGYTISSRKKYFDEALYVLDQNGEKESVLFVQTLIRAMTNLAENSGLRGEYSSSIANSGGTGLDEEDMYQDIGTIDEEFSNSYGEIEAYIEEAMSLAEKLSDQDPYLVSKVAVAKSKMVLLDVSDRASVNLGTVNRLSGTQIREKYDEEDKRLVKSIKHLSLDAKTNSQFIAIANAARMDIARLEKNKTRMGQICSDPSSDMTARYPASRLYEITKNGRVFAPGLKIKVSKNIFQDLPSQSEVKVNKAGKQIRKPRFVPVCIRGKLMAVLMYAPRITVREVNK